MKTRVKICCIGNSAEAQMAIRYGASAVGLVSAMPSGPGPIPEELIAQIAREIPPGVAPFLLTSRLDAAGILEQQRKTGVNTIQMVDTVPLSEIGVLRKAMPGIRLVQVIHVRGDDSVREALAVSAHVDALLLDSGNPSLPVKELGGTGRVHDWGLSRTIREAVKTPLFLAGGLNADNVGEAIRTVRPYGVDVCSGVRTNGALDEVKLAAFFRSVDQAGS